MQSLSTQNLYEILDVLPDASQSDIRTAYLRLKSAYGKDSLALYSLVGSDDNIEYLNQVEEAYRILSNPERRKEYDRHHGLLLVSEEVTDNNRFPAFADDEGSGNIIKMDRVPPMEEVGGDDLLIPPSTSFTMSTAASAPAANTPQNTRIEDPTRPPPTEPYSNSLKAEANEPTSESNSQIELNIQKEVSNETEFKGSFLRKIREARKISIEEIADFTKIKRSYVRAIEDEDFDQLPAAVYVRGFVIQLSKMLRIPHDKASNSFMNR